MKIRRRWKKFRSPTWSNVVRKFFASPVIFTFDTPIPLRGNPQFLLIPTKDLDQQQIDLAWAHQGSAGGYKVPSLVGLYWSAPYLHDGSAPTLLDVIGLYEKGGIERPSRSPAIVPLDLSEQDRHDLVAFLETLSGENDGAAARPKGRP